MFSHWKGDISCVEVEDIPIPQQSNYVALVAVVFANIFALGSWPSSSSFCEMFSIGVRYLVLCAAPLHDSASRCSSYSNIREDVCSGSASILRDMML